ncbi:Crp/Fnr family transcriptional regulator [Paucibacter sp. R3-3]|uniref:Crp/Fnr family transcriptional regulator n=1 Tax=Roseateles agri TaxID=3098619 RepID=A0ABU5DPG4_9BURK|nr:Crp/Fnr family transcriptional regulator [Paucibacter sp. R3-3]MDY0747540.1 Crp/Fnr family transcriptional regulator [Paucibacter sp. R3-3]
MPPNKNYLIELLPSADRQRLLAACEQVELRRSLALYVPGQSIGHAYFPIDGAISLLTQLDGHPPMQVDMVGREGMLGIQLALGVRQVPVHALVLGDGMAWRLDAAAMRRELAHGAGLRHCLNRYISVCLSEFATAAGCQRFHALAPRLARWLLMSLDRLGSIELEMTHELIANVLGVRREGVTESALKFQADGLIRYARGRVTVLNRDGLETRSCTCYAASKREYGRLLPPMPST